MQSAVSPGPPDLLVPCYRGHPSLPDEKLSTGRRTITRGGQCLTCAFQQSRTQPALIIGWHGYTPAHNENSDPPRLLKLHHSAAPLLRLRAKRIVNITRSVRTLSVGRNRDFILDESAEGQAARWFKCVVKSIGWIQNGNIVFRCNLLLATNMLNNDGQHSFSSRRRN